MKKLIHIHLKQCQSTNDEAWKALRKQNIFQKNVLVLVSADIQLKGRGRLGRIWFSNKGDLKASLAFVPPKINLETLPIIAGIAAHAALIEASKKFRVSKNIKKLWLKWPNDIYYEKNKMGGILCETKMQGSRVLGSVVGLGLNIVSCPKITGTKTTSLEKSVFKKRLSSKETALIKAFLLKSWTGKMLSLLQNPLNFFSNHTFGNLRNHFLS